jgi:hypothetical protein
VKRPAARRSLFAPSISFAAFYDVLVPSAAQAYIDPGTGSLVIQMIVGGVVLAGFAVKTFWRNIKSVALNLFRKSR